MHHVDTCRQQQGAPNSSRDQGAGQHIALAVARGLHWLHTHGIVHGDIRPSKGSAHNDKELAAHSGSHCTRLCRPSTTISSLPSMRNLEPLGCEGMCEMSGLAAVLLGDNGRDVKLADAGLSAFMHHDYMAAKSNIGPFIYTVGSCALVSASGSNGSDRASRLAEMTMRYPSIKPDRQLELEQCTHGATS